MTTKKTAMQEMVAFLEDRITPFKDASGELDDGADYYDAAYVDEILKLLFKARSLLATEQAQKAKPTAQASLIQELNSAHIVFLTPLEAKKFYTIISRFTPLPVEAKPTAPAGLYKEMVDLAHSGVSLAVAEKIYEVLKKYTPLPDKEPMECCNTCGSRLVSIRGKYPKEPERIVCPCCIVEKLEAMVVNFAISVGVEGLSDKTND